MEIKNDVVAPLLAPCFLKYADTGITPQEQRGKGIPNNVAIKIEKYESPPKYFLIVSTVKKIDKIPEINKPKIRKGEISLSKSQMFRKNSIK